MLQCIRTHARTRVRAESAHHSAARYRYIHTRLSSATGVCVGRYRRVWTRRKCRGSRTGRSVWSAFSLCRTTLNTHTRVILPCSGSDRTWRPSEWVSAGTRAPAPARCPTTRPQPQQQQHRPPPSCASAPGTHTHRDVFQRDRPHSAATRTERTRQPGERENARRLPDRGAAAEKMYKIKMQVHCIWKKDSIKTKPTLCLWNISGT